MSGNRLTAGLLKAYIVLVFAFIFAPIAASVVFSLTADRFPSLPLGEFSLQWYQAIVADPAVWEGFRNTIIAGLFVRSEERRVGKEGVSTCRSRWLPEK